MKTVFLALLAFTWIVFGESAIATSSVTTVETPTDEDFCHQITWTKEQGCQSSRCEALIGCPICTVEQTPSCHAKGFHKLVGGTKYDPPLDTSIPVTRREIKPNDQSLASRSITLISPAEVEKIVETRPVTPGILPTTKILKIELSRCEPKPGPEPPCTENSDVYKVETEKEHKLLGIVSVRSKLNYEVDASSGRIIAETKPWYLRMIPFLFNF